MISTMYRKEVFYCQGNLCLLIDAQAYLFVTSINYYSRGSSTDCIHRAALLINRVIVYRLGNCVCHRQRSIKAYSDVNIIGRVRKLWCSFVIIRIILPVRNYISAIVLIGLPDL